MRQYITNSRRALHRIPELRFDLPKTQAYLIGELQKTSAQIKTVAESGVLAFFDAGKATSVALRSDMDALPIGEAVQTDYASLHPGAMHACGHDGHMAMLLAVARYVDTHLCEMPHNVLFIFQPAEESGGGGNDIVRSGALDAYRVIRIFAHHIDPDLPSGVVASRPGALMAGATEVTIAIKGKSAHVAMSGEGKDALFAGADMLCKLYEMSDALAQDTLVKFGAFHAGNAPNIVADWAELRGTIRAFSEGALDEIKTRMFRIACETEARHGVEVEIAMNIGYPPLINDPALFHAAQAHLSACGMEMTELVAPSLLAEDFAFYCRKVPGMMMKVGLGTGIPLHAPNFDFDEGALLFGAEAFIALLQMP